MSQLVDALSECDSGASNASRRLMKTIYDNNLLLQEDTVQGSAARLPNSPHDSLRPTQKLEVRHMPLSAIEQVFMNCTDCFQMPQKQQSLTLQDLDDDVTKCPSCLESLLRPR